MKLLCIWEEVNEDLCGILKLERLKKFRRKGGAVLKSPNSVLKEVKMLDVNKVVVSRMIITYKQSKHSVRDYLHAMMC